MGWAVLLMAFPRGLEQPVQLNFEVTKMEKSKFFPKTTVIDFAYQGILASLYPVSPLAKKTCENIPSAEH